MAPIMMRLNSRPRMKTDAESQMRFQNDMLQQLEGERNRLQNRKGSLQQELNNCRQSVVRHKRAHGILRTNSKERKIELNSLNQNLMKSTSKTVAWTLLEQI